mmetsp:Transcript_2160/g.5830  ORF Transcript_2160/g.5830 Transcript_2160/m.5830 type:complete len:200 (+) Transcript_2160:1054-1653(+)
MGAVVSLATQLAPQLAVLRGALVPALRLLAHLRRAAEPCAQFVLHRRPSASRFSSVQTLPPFKRLSAPPRPRLVLLPPPFRSVPSLVPVPVRARVRVRVAGGIDADIGGAHLRSARARHGARSASSACERRIGEHVTMCGLHHARDYAQRVLLMSRVSDGVNAEFARVYRRNQLGVREFRLWRRIPNKARQRALGFQHR